MNKEEILHEIKRTAIANGGVPLGRLKFTTETGIREYAWRGKFWITWSDAVREAGFIPNEKQEPYRTDFLIEKFIQLTRELGRFPTEAHLRMKAYNDVSFPSSKAFERLGLRGEREATIRQFCRDHGGYEDVQKLFDGAEEPQRIRHEESGGHIPIGQVYLLKAGCYFKIGRSTIIERRRRELAIQLPEKAQIIHVIRTDDPAGIEAYWHARFRSKRRNGEWFVLSASEVRTFKRRKFM